MDWSVIRSLQGDSSLQPLSFGCLWWGGHWWKAVFLLTRSPLQRRRGRWDSKTASRAELCSALSIPLQRGCEPRELGMFEAVCAKWHQAAAPAVFAWSHPNGFACCEDVHGVSVKLRHGCWKVTALCWPLFSSVCPWHAGCGNLLWPLVRNWCQETPREVQEHHH